jgi:hypothetical protein
MIDSETLLGRGWDIQFHTDKCRKEIGPRGGVREFVVIWRQNGAIKRWKTRPEEFRIPVKNGLRNYAYITHENAHLFHFADECPLGDGDDDWSYGKPVGVECCDAIFTTAEKALKHERTHLRRR